MIEMSYELIPREKAIEAIRDLLLEPDSIQYIFSGDAIGVVQNVPSVPAVPLDKLCEWLAERYEPPYSLVDIDKLKRPIDFRQQKEIWINVLTKWMEGLDAEVH